MPGLSVRRSLPVFSDGAFDWSAWLASHTSFWGKGRSRLTIPDDFGNNAEILPPSLKLDASKDYWNYADAGSLDVGANNFTVGWYGQVYASTGVDQGIFGKVVVSGVLSGAYGFFLLNATGIISFQFQTSTGYFAVLTNFVVGDIVHLTAEIDNDNGLARIFNYGVQIGDDVAFTGVFGATSRNLILGGCWRHNAAIFERSARIITGCAYIYKSFLSPAQKTSILNGEYVAGASLFWVFTNAIVAYDISGNNLDTKYTNIAGNGRSLSYIAGYSYPLKYGFTIVYYISETTEYDEHIIVPSVNGVFRVAPLLPTANYYVGDDVTGSDDYINDYQCAIKFPAGVMDRSNATIFNAACRVASDYDASQPTLWSILNFQYDTYKSFINTDQNYFFSLWDNSAVDGRYSLQELYWMTSAKTGGELERIEKHLNTYYLIKKILANARGVEWENSSYFYDSKHYKVYSLNPANNFNKYIYTVDSNLQTSAPSLCATGSLAVADYHSMPSVIIDASGYIYIAHEECAGDTHDTQMLIFKSNNAGGDETGGFTLLQTIAGSWTYPQLVKCPAGIFLFLRESNRYVTIHKLNTGTDQFDFIGNIYDGGGKTYKITFRDEDESKLAIIFYTISNGVSDGVYYTESTDGANWLNAKGDVSVDITAAGIINAGNKASYAVYEDSAPYNSIVAENGLMLDGVPHIVVYEGNCPLANRAIVVTNVHIMKWNGSTWDKHTFSTTPFNYYERYGFHYFMTKKGGIYYLFHVWWDYTDTDNITYIDLYKSTNLDNWSKTELLKPDYNFQFTTAMWFTPNAPESDQLLFIHKLRKGAGMTQAFKTHEIYKIP